MALAASASPALNNAQLAKLLVVPPHLTPSSYTLRPALNHRQQVAATGRYLSPVVEAVKLLPTHADAITRHDKIKQKKQESKKESFTLTR